MLLAIALFANLIFFLLKDSLGNYSNHFFSAFFHPVTLSLVTGFILRLVLGVKYSAYQMQAEAISSRFLTWALILLGAQLSFADLSLLSSGLVASLILVLFLVGHKASSPSPARRLPAREKRSGRKCRPVKPVAS